MSRPFEGPNIEGIPLGRSFDDRRQLAPETVRALEIVRAMQRATEENEKLRYISYHDSLTGLSNERAFDEILEESVGTAISSGEKAGLALIDINGLKYTNDSFGHDKGNELIKSVAEALKSQARPQDEVFRLHGDEFAIILPSYQPDTVRGQTQKQLDSATSQRYIDQVQVAVSELGLPLDRVGISVGIAGVNLDESPKDFFRRVDAILYSHKPRRDDDQRLRPIS